MNPCGIGIAKAAGNSYPHPTAATAPGADISTNPPVGPRTDLKSSSVEYRTA